MVGEWGEIRQDVRRDETRREEKRREEKRREEKRREEKRREEKRREEKRREEKRPASGQVYYLWWWWHCWDSRTPSETGWRWGNTCRTESSASPTGSRPHSASRAAAAGGASRALQRRVPSAHDALPWRGSCAGQRAESDPRPAPEPDRRWARGGS